MKITFKETMNGKEWIHSEIMNSLTGELIDQAKDDQFYEVKLLINGHELEPKLFNKIMNNVEDFINKQAKSLIAEKLEEAEEECNKILSVFREAKENALDKLNISESDLY